MWFYAAFPVYRNTDIFRRRVRIPGPGTPRSGSAPFPVICPTVAGCPTFCILPAFHFWCSPLTAQFPSPLPGQRGAIPHRVARTGVLRDSWPCVLRREPGSPHRGDPDRLPSPWDLRRTGLLLAVPAGSLLQPSPDPPGRQSDDPRCPASRDIPGSRKENPGSIHATWRKTKTHTLSASAFLPPLVLDSFYMEWV